MPLRSFPEIQNWVAGQVSPYRLKHIQGVVQTSGWLAKRFGLPVEKARLAGWLHDCAKEKTRVEMKRWIKKAGFRLDPEEAKMPALWHPHAGAAVALLRWGIKDKGVLEAIRCHTLGSRQMSPLAQVVFVADFIEPSRKFEGVEKVRALARRSLKEAVLAKASMTMQFLFEERMKIHPRLLETWNQFLLS
jgi:predicted HD superfamily hydrolase involved in NAD metabolism